MIMHPKIRIYHRNTYTHDWGAGEPVTLYPSGQIPLNAKFCTVNEYDGIKIAFEAGHSEDRLIFDHFTEDVEKIMSPGDVVSVIDPEDTKNMPPPAHYSLRVEGPSGVWETLYLIDSKHMDFSYIQSLRSYLEERVTGVTYDLLRRRSGKWTPEAGSAPYWFNIYRNIWEKLGTIRRQVELIVQAPLDNIQRQYQRQMSNIHSDRRSQRWQNRKGLSKNPTPGIPVQFYEKRTVLTVDTPENQWLAWFLRYLRRNLNDVGLRFVLWESAKQQEYQEAFRLKNELQEELAKNERLYYQVAFKKRNDDLRKQIKLQDGLLKRLDGEVIRFAGNKQEVHRMIAWISKTLNSTWLAEVKEIHGGLAPALRLRKDPRYSALFRIFMQLRDNLKRDNSTKKNTYPYLGTAKLMEVYSVCLVTEILQGNGWEWRSGWVAGFGKETPTFSELRSGTKLQFISGGYRLELFYDMKIPRHVGKSHFGFEASVNDAPDILMALFDVEGEFIKSMVIEVKHRNHAYLVHPQARDQATDVIEQLKSYTLIRYHRPSGKQIVREAVDRVVCIYPKQDRSQPFESVYGDIIHLVQIRPATPVDPEVFGLSVLRHQIMEFLALYTSQDVFDV